MSEFDSVILFEDGLVHEVLDNKSSVEFYKLVSLRSTSDNKHTRVSIIALLFYFVILFDLKEA